MHSTAQRIFTLLCVLDGVLVIAFSSAFKDHHAVFLSPPPPFFSPCVSLLVLHAEMPWDGLILTSDGQAISIIYASEWCLCSYFFFCSGLSGLCRRSGLPENTQNLPGLSVGWCWQFVEEAVRHSQAFGTTPKREHVTLVGLGLRVLGPVCLCMFWRQEKSSLAIEFISVFVS